MNFLPRLKVWQLLVLGGVFLAGGFALSFWIAVPARRVFSNDYIRIEVDSSLGNALWNSLGDLEQSTRAMLVLGCVLAAWLWFRAIVGLRAHRRLAALAAQPTIHDLEIAPPVLPLRPARARAEVLPAPPRLGDDPFRDPPKPPAIVVAHKPVARAPAPVVTDGSGPQPKILT